MQQSKVAYEDPIRGACSTRRCAAAREAQRQQLVPRECHWHRATCTAGGCSAKCGPGINIQAYKLSCVNPADGSRQKKAQCVPSSPRRCPSRASCTRASGALRTRAAALKSAVPAVRIAPLRATTPSVATACRASTARGRRPVPTPSAALSRASGRPSRSRPALPRAVPAPNRPMSRAQHVHL